MAKATTIKVKLVSSADTGFYYVTRKNSRTMTDKLVLKKYDPIAKKHVEFRESKIKKSSHSAVRQRAPRGALFVFVISAVKVAGWERLLRRPLSSPPSR